MPNPIENAYLKLRKALTGLETPVNGTTADIIENIAENYQAPSGGVTSWNDLTDRPLCFLVDYSFDTYQWTMVGTTYDEFRTARLNGRPICGMTNGAPDEATTYYAVTEIRGHEDEDGNTWCIITNSINQEFRYNPDGTIYPNGEY